MQTIYNGSFFEGRATSSYPVERKELPPVSKSNFIMDSALFYVLERLSIDAVIKELTFASVALLTYLFMQHSGRITSLKGFGYLIGFVLVSAVVYNLYKASFKSLMPGLLCLVGGLFLLASNIHQQFFKFLSNDSIEYIIGMGALFIAFSLFKTSESY